MSTVHTYYDPIYLAEKDPADIRCTLLIRRYQCYKTKNGKTVTKFATDAVRYSTPETMAAAIEKEKMHELPEEADGNPLYVPPKLWSSSNRRVSSL